jgi:hypothetical protein
MTEQDIILQAFYLSEQDTDVWQDDSDEYELARGILHNGISRWETYDNTKWRDLLTVSDDTPLTTDHSYVTPSTFLDAGSWVRTGDSFWTIVPPENIAKYSNSQERYCYFLGDKKNGYTLNFNPNLEMSAGDLIKYEFYRKALRTEDPDDEVEMSDPMFLSYFIAAHLGEDGMNYDFFDIAEERLKQMKVRNMSGYFGIPNNIEETLPDEVGFGY